jgi:hypothetical protein
MIVSQVGKVQQPRQIETIYQGDRNATSTFDGKEAGVGTYRKDGQDRAPPTPVAIARNF